MTSLSVVLTTYNNGDDAFSALESVKWADELIVIDGYSSDQTLTKIDSIATRVIQSSNHEQLNINKNLGFVIARSEWILSLDADEIITEALGGKIREALQEPTFDAYQFPRKNYFVKKCITHGNWYPDYQIRLFRKGSGRFDCLHIHEGLRVQGKIGTINEPMLHNSYPTLHSYFNKFDRYTTFEANFLTAPSIKDFLLRIPVQTFIHAFIRNAGYRDGWRGLFIALFSSAYSQVSIVKYLCKKICNH